MNKIGFIALSIILIVADQLSKWSVTETILRPAIYDGTKGLGLVEWFVQAPNKLPYHEIAMLPFFNLVMVWNPGVSFGMLTQNTEIGAWILIILTAIITIWFSIWLFMTDNKLQSFAIAMVIGGAIGNVIDRFRFGAVIDFLDFHAFGWHYPAFNLADSCIVLGVFILIIYSLFFEKTV